MKKKLNIADDVWFEIFLHLSLTQIFKLKCVSKVWFSILSDPNFIKHWYKVNCLSLPWALVNYAAHQPDRSYGDKELRKKFTIAYPDSHSKFMYDHQNGFAFNFLNSNDGKRKNLELSTSSNGLVLCLAELSDQTTFLLYVCNPLTQKSVLLPPTPTKLDLVTGLICNEYFSSSVVSSSYKVIHIPPFEDAAKEFKVEMFCSNSGEWKICHVSRPPGVTWEYSLLDGLVTCNGVFYWFQKRSNKILAINVTGNTIHGTYGVECRLINLPDQARNMGQCLGESEGLICYATIVKDIETSLSVWVLEEDWNLLHKDNKFNDILAQMDTRLIGGATTVDLIAQIRVLGFNPFDKNVLVLGNDHYMRAYNTRTKTCERLCHPSFPGSTRPSISRISALRFSFKPRPTILPPVSWGDTSILDGIYETEN